MSLFALPLPGQDAPVAAPAATAAPAQAEYGGPSILSRGGASSLRNPTQNIRFRPYLSVNASYDSGITPVAVRSDGKVPNDSSAGGDIEVGLNGYRVFKKSSLGLDYRGDYRHYAKNSYYNGTDQTLSLLYRVQTSRRVEFMLRESAGLFSRALFDAPLGLIDSGFANVPTNDLFDNRTMNLSTMADLTYSKSARTSFDFGGDAFIVRRRSSALNGVTGSSGRADFAYRTSRVATTGFAYNFTHYEYTKGFGATDVHTISIVQSYRIGRSWELALRAGGARVETLGLAQVSVDPVIAAITGQTQGIEAVYRLNWLPSGQVALSRSFRRSNLSFSYNYGVNPGNGVYLTSRSKTGSASYGYSGLRRVSLGASFSYATLGSLSQNLAQYSSYTAGGGATVKLTGALHFISRYDFRHYDLDQTTFRRNSYRVSLGFGFSPGDIPLALW
jgi:hypothetical protein